MTRPYRTGRTLAGLETALHGLHQARSGVDVLTDDDCRLISEAERRIGEVQRRVMGRSGQMRIDNNQSGDK